MSTDLTREDSLLTTATTTSTWSKPRGDNGGGTAAGSNGSSRFGVRKRVKAVLEQAKTRTGLLNRNTDASIVAETASMGGLDESADLAARARSPHG